MSEVKSLCRVASKSSSCVPSRRPRLERRLGKKTIGAGWARMASSSSSSCRRRPQSSRLPPPSPSAVPGRAAAGSAPSREASGCSLASSRVELALSHVVAGAVFDASPESRPPALVSCLKPIPECGFYFTAHTSSKVGASGKQMTVDCHV